MFDELIKNKLSFNEIMTLTTNIKRKFNNNNHYYYPYEIDNYYLDSFIIVISKGLDSHFSFIKKDNNEWILYNGFIHNIKLSSLDYLNNERIIFKENGIYDTLEYKVCFICYCKY